MSLLINSYQRSFIANGKDNFKLKNPLTDGRQLQLKSFVIVVDAPNINPLNSQLFIDDGLQSFPVVIAEGKYTYLELRTAIENALNATGAAVFTVTFLNSKYTVTSSVGISFGKLTENKSVWDMMGLKLNVTDTVHLGGAPNINFTNYVHINSFELTRFKKVLDTGSTNNSNVLCSIRAVSEDLLHDVNNLNSPTSVQSQILSREFDNYKYVKINPSQTLYNVDIYITDDDGNDIGQYVNYSLEFIIE